MAREKNLKGSTAEGGSSNLEMDTSIYILRIRHTKNIHLSRTVVSYQYLEANIRIDIPGPVSSLSCTCHAPAESTTQASNQLRATHCTISAAGGLVHACTTGYEFKHR